MKALLIFLATIFSVAMTNGQPKQDSFLTANMPLQITGKIIHYQANDKNGFVTFRTYDITGSLKDTSLPVNPDGNFHVRLWQPFEGDIAMMYQHRYATLYAASGEKITLKINEDAWSHGKSILQSMTVTGKSAAITNAIIDLNDKMEKAGLKKNISFTGNTDEDYANACIARMEKQLAFLRSYVMRKKLEQSSFQGNIELNNKNANPKKKLNRNVFENWYENNIRYKTGKMIAFKCFAGKVNKSITHKKLIELLKDIPLNNSGAAHSSAYYQFMHLLAGDFEIIVNINDDFKGARQQRNSLSPIFLKEIDRYTNGFAKQLLYYNIYASNRNEPYAIAPFEKVVTNRVLKNLLNKKKESSGMAFAAYDLIQRIRAYPVNDTFKQQLIKIFEAEKEHYVYLDFWGIWCGSCMAEMPLYPKVIAKFNDKPVQFIFFAVRTGEKKAKEVKEKYDIQGKFIALSENEIYILNNVMQFSAYPMHFIMSPEGSIIDKSIYRKSVVRKLAKLLPE